DRLALRRPRHGYDFAFGLQVGDGNGSPEDVGGSRLVHLVDRGHPGFAFLDHTDAYAYVAFGDVLMDAVVGEACEGTVPLGDHDLGLGRRRRLEQPVDEPLDLALFSQPRCLHAFHFRMPTLTCWKRAGAAPCATCAVCGGCPLPQLASPQTDHSLRPAIASQEFQNSGVMPA